MTDSMRGTARPISNLPSDCWILSANPSVPTSSSFHVSPNFTHVVQQPTYTKERVMRELDVSAWRTMRRTLIFALPILLSTSGSAAAQVDYPTRTVRIVLGFGPGTSPDVALRAFADKLSRKLGK